MVLAIGLRRMCDREGVEESKSRADVELKAFSVFPRKYCFDQKLKRRGLHFMRLTKHLFLTVLTLAALSIGAWTQTSDTTTPPPKKRHKPVEPAITAADVQALKDAIAAQQAQIQQLNQQIQQLQQNGQQAQAAAAAAATQAQAAQTQAATAQSQTVEQQQAVAELKTDVATVTTTANNTAATVQESLKDVKNVSSEWETPVSLHFKGITITPGGFAEAAFVRRSRELGADLPTPFNPARCLAEPVVGILRLRTPIAGFGIFWREGKQCGALWLHLG
jgi:hypothetical protein